MPHNSANFEIGIRLLNFPMLNLDCIVTIYFMIFFNRVYVKRGFNYGRGNSKELNKIIKYSLLFIFSASIILFVLNFVFAKSIVGIYLTSESPIYDIAVHGVRFYSISYLFSGIDLFGTSFFTAFGNGKISAVISAQLLPFLFSVEGIWLIRPLTQVLAVFLVIYFMKKYQKKYDYKLTKSILDFKYMKSKKT